MVHNRAIVAFSSGDLPAALAFFDQAAARYQALHLSMPALTMDRCAVLLAAGLATDALAEADTALGDIEQARGRSTARAELLLTAASCALAAAQPQAALDSARTAQRLFRSQQSAWWQAHTAGVLVQARYAGGPVSARLLREAEQAATRLAELGSGDAARAHLLAGRVALDLGRRQEADRHLVVAARSRKRGPAMTRASGWLSEALRAEAAGESRRLSPRATAGSGCWTSTRSRWAPRSFGRRPPRTAPSWPRWPSGTRRSPAARGCCWPGASGGGPPRWPCPPCGRRPTPS